MHRLAFQSNPEPSLGVELELAIVDMETMALSNSANRLIESLPEAGRSGVKPELMQCYLELNTGICETVADVEADLRRKLAVVQGGADRMGLGFLWSGTHPFSSWRDQEITPNPRYHALVNLLQEMGRQLVTFGLHVHVGVNSGDKAILICEQIQTHLPLLLALSANSPCWEGRVTGLHSIRSKVMEALPTAGLPTRLRNWSEYTWLINHLVETGFINTIREIWWDVRPHHNFGTVEIRICDMPADLDEVLALTALMQCLVHHLSTRIEEGYYVSEAHPVMVRQNKWRAARFGRGARLVDPVGHSQHGVDELAEELTRSLMPAAAALGCAGYLERIPELARRPDGAARQMELLATAPSPAEAVARMVELSRLGGGAGVREVAAPHPPRGTAVAGHAYNS